MNKSIQGEETAKQTEELYSLMMDLNREWYDDDDCGKSQVVKQIKTVDTSKYLGLKYIDQRFRDLIN